MADDIRRGDIWWTAFGPSVGGEITKTRPAIVVSTNSSNQHLNRIQVVPVTSSVRKLYPSEVYVTLQNRQSKAAADQLMTVSKMRLRSRIGVLAPDELASVEQAIRLQLKL